MAKQEKNTFPTFSMSPMNQAASGSEPEPKPPHPITLITYPASPPQTSLPSTRTKPNQTKPHVY